MQDALHFVCRNKKKKYYLKRKVPDNSKENKSPPKKVFSQSYVDELNQQIAFLQNEKNVLEEQIEEFLNENKKKDFFHNGKYDDCIRMVYQDLMCTAGLSARNVQRAIKIVLTKFTGNEVERLPKATFANYMLMKFDLFPFLIHLTNLSVISSLCNESGRLSISSLIQRFNNC